MAAQPLGTSHYGIVHLSSASVSISLAYVVVVAVVTTIASLVSPVAGQLAAWLLTLGPGTLDLGFLYYWVVPLLDAAGGPVGLPVMILGYTAAAVVNVVLALGVITLWRELRQSRVAPKTRPGTFKVVRSSSVVERALGGVFVRW